MGHRRHPREDDEADAKPTAASAPAPPLPARRPQLSPGNAPFLQQTIGNAALARLVHPEPGERVGEGEYVDALGEPGALGGQSLEVVVEHVHGAPDIGQGEENEFGELTGEIDTGVPVCLFIDGGKVGEGLVGWAGGPGGKGLQNVGSVALTAPEYEGSDADDKGTAKAWVKPGTGTAKVTRTFNGVRLGDNGVYYFTAGAVARADVHEKAHVTSSKTIHDAHLAPLEQRVKQHTGAGQGLAKGSTKAEAIEALKQFVDWNGAVKSFQTEDTAANTPMGTVDTQDMARADFIKDYGAQTVGGVAYAHYIDIPPGPKATPPKKASADTAEATVGVA